MDVIELALGAMVAVCAALLLYVLYMAFDEGLGEDYVLKGGVVISKSSHTYPITTMAGKVPVTTMHTDYTVVVDVKGIEIKADVSEDQYEMVDEGNTVNVGYTKGRFSSDIYYNAVHRTIKYPDVEN